MRTCRRRRAAGAGVMDDSVSKFARHYREVLRRYLVEPDEAILNPVSYTHLTLPTIYSV